MWLADEDRIITASVKAIGFRWRTIAGYLPGRSDDAVRNRWNRLQEAFREESNQTTSVEMDRFVKAGYKCSKCGQPKRNHLCTYQPGSKDAASDNANNRRVGSGPQRLSWTRQEDELIRNNVCQWGPKWSLIASKLVGRTEHAVRNRWHRLQNIEEDEMRAEGRNGLSEPRLGFGECVGAGLAEAQSVDYVGERGSEDFTRSGLDRARDACSDSASSGDRVRGGSKSTVQGLDNGNDGEEVLVKTEDVQIRPSIEPRRSQGLSQLTANLLPPPSQDLLPPTTQDTRPATATVPTIFGHERLYTSQSWSHQTGPSNRRRAYKTPSAYESGDMHLY